MTTMTVGMPLLAFLIAVALAFDFSNGVHDSSNSIATVVSTRVLRPQHAVIWAAFFNFIAFFVFGLHVANTIGKGIIDPAIADSRVIFGALGGAIAWNVITWHYGIPSSSSHALIGGLIGSALAKTGSLAVLVWSGIITTTAAIVLSPVLGFVLAQLLMLVVIWTVRKQRPFAVDRVFRVLQLFSAAAYSIGHGGNDAQKTIGLIGILLYSQGLLGPDFHIPFWVVLACQSAMALGTLMGGWRIVRTLGSRITHLKPMQGFCAEGAGAATLFLATSFGIPVSTTHTITGGVMGAGSALRTSAVHWGVAQGIVLAWIITIPASATIAAVVYWISAPLFG